MSKKNNNNPYYLKEKINYPDKTKVIVIKPPELLEEERLLEQEVANQYRNFFGRGAYKFAIYPSYWKDSWGKSPLLGIVYADNEFLAERLAYDRGILPTPCNCTFGPKIKNLGPANTKIQ